jgi:hypothetical protein
MTPRFTLMPFEFFVFPTRTRFPFRYGIASMTEVPHLFLRTQVRVAGGASPGLAAEGLPPKWFTKDPTTTFDQDLPELHATIRHAATCAFEIGRAPVTFFEFWRELTRQQDEWARSRRIAPLLAHLGVSLCERAVLDGLCRALDQPIHRLILDNRLGLRLGDIYPELGGAEPRDLLPGRPLARVQVRHTVGLADPLTGGEIASADRVEDGLPQDLDASIRAYGLHYFKIKLSGQRDHDRVRLEAVAHVLDAVVDDSWLVTVDGNENFSSMREFQEFWVQLADAPALRALVARVVAIEQPIKRDRTLDPESGETLEAWTTHPPLIIDESDGAVGDVARALALGYAGASHKNCKGIIKGLATACLLANRRREGLPAILTGEDLCNLGPVALLEDLAMMSLLGIEHVERNGHHYYRGLSMWPDDWQDAVIAKHPDLYHRVPPGFARLRIDSGQIELGTVNRAPFGLHPLLDPATLKKTGPGNE